MRYILFLLMIVIGTAQAKADEVIIELNPKKPVVGETFQAFFRIKTDLNEEPMINFSPFRVEVIGKNNYGVKTSSQWINGKFSSTRELTIVYDLVSNSPGLAGFRDISVKVGNKTLRHPSMNFEVLKEPEVLPEVFVMADVPKKEIYIGEGVVAKYYLYTKTQITNLDVKKYPKLNGFSKRFLQEPDRQERVSVNGVVYLRSLVYSSKLFAERVGSLKIDPLHLSVTYLVNRGNDQFSSFGFNTQTKEKSIASEDVKINVIPVPENGKDDSFTGLVGKHEIRLDVNDTKFIVNQPMEFKLTITGVGALENLDAPILVKDPSLEEFEKNGDLKILDSEKATKVFDYTYLPKENKILPEKNIKLSYFDPDQKVYIPIMLNIPEMRIAGGQAKLPEKNPQNPESKEKPEVQVVNTESFESTFKDYTLSSHILTRVNIGIVSILIMIMLGFSLWKSPLTIRKKTNIPTEFQKGQFTLASFLKWIDPITAKTGKSPEEVLENIELSDEAQSYFKNLIDSYYRSVYSEKKASLSFSYSKKHFKELDHKIKEFKNESNSES